MHITPTQLFASLLLALGASTAACDATSDALDGAISDAAIASDAGTSADAATPADAGAAEDAGTPSDAGALADAGSTADSGCAAHVPFTAVQDQVFVGCGGRGPGPMGCHSREPFQGGLDLTPGSAWAELVSHASVISPALRVVPGDPAASFLWKKLVNDLPADMTQGDPMPKGEAIQWRPLPDAQLELVRCWIAEGAPND